MLFELSSFGDPSQANVRLIYVIICDLINLCSLLCNYVFELITSPKNDTFLVKLLVFVLRKYTGMMMHQIT